MKVRSGKHNSTPLAFQKVLLSVDSLLVDHPAAVYLFQVNNGDTRTVFEICSKLIIKTPDRRHSRIYGISIVNFEPIYQYCYGIFPCWHDTYDHQLMTSLFWFIETNFYWKTKENF